MKLQLTAQEIVSIIQGKTEQISEQIIDVLYYDTRLIFSSKNGVFFALKGHKDGHIYASKAYEKGIRIFVVSDAVELPEDATIIYVEDTLRALQKIAKNHREQFNYPVIAITGSLGKTTIKEALYYLLKDDFNIVRSPKSFNSQIGVAISLLELSKENTLAIIEADISHPGEMYYLEDMISPTLGIYTGIGKYYADNFTSQEEHSGEHLLLFKYANITFSFKHLKPELRRNKINFELVDEQEWNDFDFSTVSYANNYLIALHVASFLGGKREELIHKASYIPTLSNRMEVFEGQDNNLIINDSYNIDIDALEQALAYQFASDEREDKIVVLSLENVNEKRKREILNIVNGFHPKKVYLIKNNELPKELLQTKGSSILFKGSYRSSLKDLVLLFKNRKHETWVEFDLRAIEHNILQFRSKLPKNTKLLIMVKASSYGSGDVRLPHFFQQKGIDYLGVAYVDEGVTLRENNITLPIFVINTETDASEDIIRFNLEPSIVSKSQLDSFVAKLREKGIKDFPIHINVETGMNRLGFDKEVIDELISKIKSSPEVKVKGVYSHLSDADNRDDSYSIRQIEKFRQIKEKFENQFDYSILFHLLNSEGASKFGGQAAFDMVRLGIGIFGYTSTAEKDELLPTFRWKTTISQIKEIQTGETVGYGRAFKADKSMRIATVRVGYADGFRRSLGNGVGSVFINGVECSVVGNVCMDMTMVDVSQVACKAGDEVEIIGEHIDMKAFAERMETIPYEVMTGISKRVAKVYLR